MHMQTFTALHGFSIQYYTATASYNNLDIIITNYLQLFTTYSITDSEKLVI